MVPGFLSMVSRREIWMLACKDHNGHKDLCQTNCLIVKFREVPLTALLEYLHPHAGPEPRYSGGLLTRDPPNIVKLQSHTPLRTHHQEVLT